MNVWWLLDQPEPRIRNVARRSSYDAPRTEDAMPKKNAKAVTAKDVEAAEAKQAVAADKLEAAKASYRDASASADAARSQYDAQVKLEAMGADERAALAQALDVVGIESAEAVGTPNGGDN